MAQDIFLNIYLRRLFVLIFILARTAQPALLMVNDKIIKKKIGDIVRWILRKAELKIDFLLSLSSDDSDDWEENPEICGVVVVAIVVNVLYQNSYCSMCVKHVVKFDVWCSLPTSRTRKRGKKWLSSSSSSPVVSDREEFVTNAWSNLKLSFRRRRKEFQTNSERIFS